MKKLIKLVLAAKEKHITEEETVLQPLPHRDFRFANPLIVLHHMPPKRILAGTAQRIHPHPHRGFAPVTFQLQGEGFHKDNAGHEETIQAGDVQWMFAGKGILHSEGPSKDILDRGGIQELIQLWINVPRANKWDIATYQHVGREQLPKVIRQEGADLRLASGNYDGKKGLLQTHTPAVSIIGDIEKGKRIQLTATPGYWTLLYIAKGMININLETVDKYHLVIFEKENEEIFVCAEEDATILFLSAQPLDEPVAAKGNFVMNTPQEIEQARADYKNGVFGTLDF